MKRRLLFVALTLGSLAAACQLIVGIERTEKADRPPDTGAPDAPTPGPPDPCVHVGIPRPPENDDDITGAIPPFVMAIRKFEVPGPGEPVGFDLDGVCTGDNRSGAAFDGGPSCKAALPLNDLDGGVDNQLANVIGGFDLGGSTRQFIENGQQTALLRISGYNGKRNDKSVELELFTSEGIREPSPCPGVDAGMTAEGIYPPGWCGDDKWSVSASTVEGSGDRFLAKARGTGYVTDWTLVVQVDGETRLPFAGYDIRIGSPMLVGKLVALDKANEPRDAQVPTTDPEVQRRWRLDDATFGGRVPARDMLAAVGILLSPVQLPKDAGAKTYVCEVSAIFNLAIGNVCNARDIASSYRLDHDPNVACDAVSLALRAQYVPVLTSVVTPTSIEENQCYPDGGGGTIGVPGVVYECP